METAIEVKERPILFSGPMVRAILEGRKTQTRRVLKPQPLNLGVVDTVWGFGVRNSDPDNFSAHIRKPDGEDIWVRCPYGRPGDRLWVRETFRIVDRLAGGENCHEDKAVRYAATWEKSNSGLAWKPSIHMPRWASRITLEATGIRVQRVQDISGEDAYNEGIETQLEWLCAGRDMPSWERARVEFSKLWDSINLKRGYGWEANPWVWVVEFKKVEA